MKMSKGFLYPIVQIRYKQCCSRSVSKAVGVKEAKQGTSGGLSSVGGGRGQQAVLGQRSLITPQTSPKPPCPEKSPGKQTSLISFNTSDIGKGVDWWQIAFRHDQGSVPKISMRESWNNFPRRLSSHHSLLGFSGWFKSLCNFFFFHWEMWVCLIKYFWCCCCWY